MTDQEYELLGKVIDQYLSDESISQVQAEKAIEIIDDFSKLESSRLPDQIKLSFPGGKPVLCFLWDAPGQTIYFKIFHDGEHNAGAVVTDYVTTGWDRKQMTEYINPDSKQGLTYQESRHIIARLIQMVAEYFEKNSGGLYKGMHSAYNMSYSDAPQWDDITGELKYFTQINADYYTVLQTEVYQTYFSAEYIDFYQECLTDPQQFKVITDRADLAIKGWKSWERVLDESRETKNRREKLTDGLVCLRRSTDVRAGTSKRKLVG